MGRHPRAVLDRDGPYNGGSVQVKSTRTENQAGRKRPGRRVARGRQTSSGGCLNAVIVVLLVAIVVAWALGF